MRHQSRTNRAAPGNPFCAKKEFIFEIPDFQRPSRGIRLRRAKTQTKKPLSSAKIEDAARSNTPRKKEGGFEEPTLHLHSSGIHLHE